MADSNALTASYYEASIRPRRAYVALEGSTETDVCVVGGGLAGCSAALHLAQRGYRVVLIESHRMGWGASGRSGGQIIPGFASEQSKLDQLVGRDLANRMWDISVESIDLLRDLIARHAIECDWRPGQLQVGLKPRHREGLIEWHRELVERYRYNSTRLIDASGLQELLATDRYCVGLHDANGGHLHPLKYTLGLAEAAAKAGVRIHEGTEALEVVAGSPAVVRTIRGDIRSRFVVLCGNAYLGNVAPSVRRRIMPVATYIVATEPLGASVAQSLIRDNSGVTDLNFILDYFRRSADDRLLFGGRVSYSGRETFNTARATQVRMVKVFPQLAGAKIDYAWGGLLDITMNRAPDFGRVADNIYYLQGFSGHGVALTGIAGKVAAEAIAGQAERFDLFSRIKHRDFPGGAHLRTPALVLAMLWYRLRDLL